ncbi:reverse transcriptase domain-containing protein [Tanacetum coccineum]
MTYQRLYFTRKRVLSLPNTAYPTLTIRRTSFGFHPFQFSYPPTKLTMEEMLCKFIDKGRREHEETGAFIREFKTTNELLLKERNNSLRDLEFEVYGLSKAINDAQSSNYKVKGVTTRGGKTTTEIVHDTNNINEEPPILHHDKPVEPNKVLVETKPQETKEQTIQPSTPLIPFPHRLKKEKEDAQQRKFLENLKQLHINTPFTEALSQMPKYAKFPKGLLSNKTRLEEACTVTMNERCSIIFLNKLPSKEKDPGSFTIPCDIGHLHINNALADLGASISLMPYTMYKKLGLREPKPTRMSLELADRSIQYLQGIAENVLIKIDKFIFLIDFVILDMQEDFKIPIILGRPFLETAQAMIDVFNKKITLRVGNEEVLEKCKGAIAWKMSDIKGISPSFCTHKILMEESFKPVIQPQRRLNPKVQDVVKNEIVKLLDSGLIYPISDSPWVIPIHVFPKKGGMTVDSFKFLSHQKIKRRQLLLVLMELLRTEGCNLDYATLQRPLKRCMTTIFHDMVEDFMEVFMDNFSVFGIVLGHKISGKGIEVDKAKIVVIAKLPYLSNVKGQRIDGKFKPIYYASKTLNDAQAHYTTTEKELLAIVFSFDKFCPYLILSKTIVYTDHSALKYSFSKQDAKPRLIRWLLLLQGFNIEIKDKKGAENLADDHLSRLENPNMGELAEDEITDKFPNEHLMILKAKLKEPWYADYVNYLIRKVVPLKWMPERRKWFFSQVRNYFWDEPYAFRLCPDNVIRICVARNEILEILTHCPSGPTRGHHSASVTGRKDRDDHEGKSPAGALIDIPVFVEKFSILTGFTIIDDEDVTRDVALGMPFFIKVDVVDAKLLWRSFDSTRTKCDANNGLE